MAKNEVSSHDGGVHIYTTVTASTASGIPVWVGTHRPATEEGRYTNLTGTLLTTATTGGSSLVDTAEQIFDHLVRGWGPTTNVAVAIGDPVYIQAAVSGGIAGCWLDRDYVSGSLFGFALEPVTSGGTDTIWVRQKG